MTMLLKLCRFCFQCVPQAIPVLFSDIDAAQNTDTDENICKDPHFHFMLILIFARLHDFITKDCNDGVYLESGTRDASESNGWVSCGIVGQFSQVAVSLFPSSS